LFGRAIGEGFTFWKIRDGGAVEKPFFKEIFSINLLSPSGRGLR